MTTNTVFPAAILLAFMILIPAIHGQDDDALPIVKGYGESAWGQCPGRTAVFRSRT